MQLPFNVALVLGLGLLVPLVAACVIAAGQEARARARALLLRAQVLSSQEEADICALGYFFLVSPTQAATVYRIPREQGALVRVYVHDVPKYGLCVSLAAEGLPPDDEVVARKLWIMGREDDFCRIGNHIALGGRDEGDDVYQRRRQAGLLQLR